ncbi:MAG TPA: hypothetical protein VFQ78_01560 [Candidatus Udaeobacter sp.]|nr:hypothetical protein [Candidatus Udaeobacter sp.]
MKPNRFIACVVIICGCFAGSHLDAATIPAGTTLTIQTVSLITSQNTVGRSFEAKLAQDVSVKGNVALKAGTKVFGKIVSSRANPRKSEPLSVELASIDLGGRRIPVKTTSVDPSAGPRTARQAHYGHTGGTTVVNPGSTMQFQVLQAVTF